MNFKSDLIYKTRVGANGIPFPAETRRKIFLSYRKMDNNTGLRDRMAEYILEAADCAVWFDAALTPGEDYDKEITSAIRESDAVVLLLTPHVMESDYIWNIEIKTAQELHKGIIPVFLGLSQEHFEVLNERLGHIHIISAEKLVTEGVDPEEQIRAKEELIDQLRRALYKYIVNQDIARRVSAFYTARKHELPFVALTVEQIYLFAYGMLNGIGTDAQMEKAVDILTSLLSLYSPDTPTNALMGEVCFDLMKYYMKVLDTTRALDYADRAIRYGCIAASDYLGELYRDGEGLPRNPKKAKEMFAIGADKNHLPSLRLMIALLYRDLYVTYDKNKRFEHTALPYIERAYEHGSYYDALYLLATLWNARDISYIRRLPLTETAQKYPEFSSVIESVLELYCKLSEERCESSHMQVVKYNIPYESDLGIVMEEFTADGYTYRLTKKKTGDNTSLVFLVDQNNRVLFRDDCVWGWGECPHFECGVEDDFLYLKTADFDHYSVETDFATMLFLNPRSEQVLTLRYGSGTMRGRHTLKHSAMI